ncbi:MAG: AMP-binding protein [Candidatus Dormibacteraeota bacterium]|nr:AMP-binding protein [Candidatus Dormibacteraeota bacterium]
MQNRILDLTLRRGRAVEEGGARSPLRASLSVADLISERAYRSPGRLAFSDGVDGRELRYGELGSLAARWWALLVAAGIGDGRRVALQVADPLSFASSYLGLLAAGVTVVPLDAGMSPGRLASLLELLEVELLVSDLRPASDGAVPVWRLDGELGELREVRGRLRLRPFAVVPQPALLLVGADRDRLSRAIPLAEGQLLYVARQVVHHHRLQSWDRGYSPLPPSDINSQVAALLATLLSGGSLVLDRHFRPGDFWSIADSNGVTWIDATPGMLAVLADQRPPEERTAGRVRFARTASAPVPVGVLERFQAHSGVSVLETYGLPEAASQVTANPLQRGGRRAASVGLPVGVQLRVVDVQREESAPGRDGSIEIRGPSVISHYLDLELGRYHRARAADGWLVTGTRGHLDEDGFLYLTSPAPAVGGRRAAAHGHDPVAVGGSSLNRSADSPILVRKVAS